MNEITGTIQATGKDGQTRTFEYNRETEREYGVQRYTYMIVQGMASFQLDLQDEGCRLKVVALFHQGSGELRAMGLPDALIHLANVQFNKKVVSSSDKPEHHTYRGGGEYRTVDAEKVWRRLNANTNFVSYDEDEGVYTYDSLNRNVPN